MALDKSTARRLQAAVPTITTPVSTTAYLKSSRSSATRSFRKACYRSMVTCSIGSTLNELPRGIITHPLDISDVWKNRYSASNNHKIWAAEFAARHPNLAAIELSSFKCGHDAPIYNVIERILEKSRTPFFAFKDLDENKPAGSLRIRVETVDHFLRLHRERTLGERVEAAIEA